MTNTPSWLAATTGQPPLAGQVNQFLGTHRAQILYTGSQAATQTTAGSGTVNTNGLYLAQSFTTAAGQTAVGYVTADIGSLASSASQLGPTSLSLYASVSGAPGGTALAATTLTTEYVFDSPTYVPVPLPASGLTASTMYWLVLAAAGNASYSYTWAKSNQTSGASTSNNGTTWTAQAYGLLYTVYDQSALGNLAFTYEDGGARWTSLLYTSPQGQIASFAEYTAGQTAAGYLQSYRNFSYTNGLLTGVA